MPGEDINRRTGSRINDLSSLGGKLYQGEIKEGDVVVEENGEELFRSGGYGKLKDGELHLENFEAMNLINRGKIEIHKDNQEISKEEFYQKSCQESKDFPEKLLVYQDLRKRGFVVRPAYNFPGDLRIYERGTSFEENESNTNHVKWVMDVVRTTEPFSLKGRAEKIERVKNIRAKLALGIVDEEGDVTYYRINEEKKLNTSGQTEKPSTEKKIIGYLQKNSVVVWENINEIYEPYYFGKKRSDRLELNLLEAYYLQEMDILKIKEKDKEIDQEKLRVKARKKDQEFEKKYQIYKDLRSKGFLVRSGFKFGTHFRVYGRGVELKKGAKSPSEHTKWVVHAVSNDFNWSYPELSRFVRLALNIRSKPTLALINQEKKYYRMVRIKP